MGGRVVARAWWLVAATGDYLDGYYAHVVFALVNAGFLAYAISRYMGFRVGFGDLRRDLHLRFPRLAVPLLGHA